MINLQTTLSPTITDLVRLDHKAVNALFNKYDPRMSRGQRRALANTICLALGVHAELEQELLYPFMRPHVPMLVQKSIGEHIEMFRRIMVLWKMRETDERFDATVRSLMTQVLEHAAEEERTLLPEVERVLRPRLRELGAQMNRRRLQLARPVAGKLGLNAARALPGATALLGLVALLAGAALLRIAVAE